MKLEMLPYKNINLKTNKILALHTSLFALLTFFAVVVTLIIGGNEIVNGVGVASTIMLLVDYISDINGHMQSLLNHAHGVISKYNAYLRIFKIVELSKETDDGTENLDKVNSIEFDNVKMSYDGENVILEDINLKIENGEFICIIGKNGSGKSTFSKILAGLTKFKTGDIIINEINLKDKKNFLKIRKNIGIVFQNPENQILFDKVYDDIAFSLKNLDIPYSEFDSRIDEALKKVNMLEYKNSSSFELSLGQKQKIAIASALAINPKILILDEPTNDLDIQTLTILENYLDTFSGAVITVSHDRYFLDKIANRIFAFEKNGNIKQYEGGYSDYKQKAEHDIIEQTPTVKKQNTQIRTQRVKKMTYMEQREYETIGDTISDLEQKLQQIKKQECECASDYVKLQEISLQKQEIETALEDTMQRWVYLSELAEEIEKSKEEHNKWKI